MSIFVEQAQKQIEIIKREIEEVQSEMDRCDSFDGFRVDLKNKLAELTKELAQNEGFIKRVS